jgi:hypothetical protein
VTEQRLDIHYEGRTADGNRLRLTAYQCKPPLKTDPFNVGTEEEPLWLNFICGHTARHDEADDDDTDACYPCDPEFDD